MVALCPHMSHRVRRVYEPGFVFLPADLQFFIDYELQDRQRWSRDRSLGRQVPTSEIYKNHLVAKGMIGPPASSGLYRPVFLDKDYIPTVLMNFLEPSGATQPKPWHGAPLVALRRAFLALGSSRIFVIDEETVNQLRILFDLYFKPAPANPINFGSWRPKVPP